MATEPRGDDPNRTVTDVLDVALREVDNSGTGSDGRRADDSPRKTPPPPPASDESLDQDFAFTNLDKKDAEDADVGRVIDFDDTPPPGEQEASRSKSGEFVLDPFQSSRGNETAPRNETPQPRTPTVPAEDQVDRTGSEPAVEKGRTFAPPPREPAAPRHSDNSRAAPPRPADNRRPAPQQPAPVAPAPTPSAPPVEPVAAYAPHGADNVQSPPPQKIEVTQRDRRRPSATETANEISVSIPVTLSRSLAGKTIPVKIELEVQFVDDE
jgi:hypothetical protein